MGPKDQDKKLSTLLYYLTVTHRLPVQQGQDYPESDNMCVEVCVRTRVLEGMQKWIDPVVLRVSTGEGVWQCEVNNQI